MVVLVVRNSVVDGVFVLGIVVEPEVLFLLSVDPADEAVDGVVTVFVGLETFSLTFVAAEEELWPSDVVLGIVDELGTSVEVITFKEVLWHSFLT